MGLKLLSYGGKLVLVGMLATGVKAQFDPSMLASCRTTYYWIKNEIATK